MRSLRRSILLAAVAAAGIAPSGASAASARVVTGIPCTLNAIAPAGVGAYSGTLSCYAWIDLLAAREGTALNTSMACGTIQVGSADALGPWSGAATTCGGGAAVNPNGGLVQYAARPTDTVYVCTYVVTGDHVNRVYDADTDSRNGNQCARVRTDSDTSVSGCQGGFCLAVIGEAKDVIDLDPYDPDDGFDCAGCLSGWGPVVDDVYEQVLAVDLSRVS